MRKRTNRFNEWTWTVTGPGPKLVHIYVYLNLRHVQLCTKYAELLTTYKDINYAADAAYLISKIFWMNYVASAESLIN